uniref:CAM kinase, CDPK family n=1 Tax=Toxoplasma gondii COUG TaxID=1074873 RepID=A0A2G8XMV4_TOXGO|nr:CAM kinase, CDPK family [Toxoplasma gondii COUG]
MAPLPHAETREPPSCEADSLRSDSPLTAPCSCFPVAKRLRPDQLEGGALVEVQISDRLHLPLSSAFLAPKSLEVESDGGPPAEPFAALSGMQTPRGESPRDRAVPQRRPSWSSFKRPAEDVSDLLCKKSASLLSPSVSSSPVLGASQPQSLSASTSRAQSRLSSPALSPEEGGSLWASPRCPPSLLRGKRNRTSFLSGEAHALPQNVETVPDLSDSKLSHLTALPGRRDPSDPSGSQWYFLDAALGRDGALPCPREEAGCVSSPELCVSPGEAEQENKLVDEEVGSVAAAKAVGASSPTPSLSQTTSHGGEDETLLPAPMLSLLHQAPSPCRGAAGSLSPCLQCCESPPSRKRIFSRDPCLSLSLLSPSSENFSSPPALFASGDRSRSWVAKKSPSFFAPSPWGSPSTGLLATPASKELQQDLRQPLLRCTCSVASTAAPSPQFGSQHSEFSVSSAGFYPASPLAGRPDSQSLPSVDWSPCLSSQDELGNDPTGEATAGLATEGPPCPRNGDCLCRGKAPLVVPLGALALLGSCTLEKDALTQQGRPADDCAESALISELGDREDSRLLSLAAGPQSPHSPPGLDLPTPGRLALGPDACKAVESEVACKPAACPQRRLSGTASLEAHGDHFQPQRDREDSSRSSDLREAASLPQTPGVQRPSFETDESAALIGGAPRRGPTCLLPLGASPESLREFQKPVLPLAPLERGKAAPGLLLLPNAACEEPADVDLMHRRVELAAAAIQRAAEEAKKAAREALAKAAAMEAASRAAAAARDAAALAVQRALSEQKLFTEYPDLARNIHEDFDLFCTSSALFGTASSCLELDGSSEQSAVARDGEGAGSREHSEQPSGVMSAKEDKERARWLLERKRKCGDLSEREATEMSTQACTETLSEQSSQESAIAGGTEFGSNEFGGNTCTREDLQGGFEATGGIAGGLRTEKTFPRAEAGAKVEGQAARRRLTRMGKHLVLGEGRLGKVILAEERETRRPAAVKMIDKRMLRGANVDQQNFRQEVEVHRRLPAHRNIVGMRDVYEDRDTLYMVMELCDRANLLDKIVEEGPLEEDLARKIFLQILAAVMHCHQHNIVHRDLKPENILFALPSSREEAPNLACTCCGSHASLERHLKSHEACGDWRDTPRGELSPSLKSTPFCSPALPPALPAGPRRGPGSPGLEPKAVAACGDCLCDWSLEGPRGEPQPCACARKSPLWNATVKLTDFGAACASAKGELLGTACGTVHYLAPEVLMGNYYDGFASDAWSLGVVLFTMLAAAPPFNGPTHAELTRQITRGEYHMTGRAWWRVSSEAKDLIRRLLVVRPQHRLRVEDVVHHPWVVRAAPAALPSFFLDNPHCLASLAAAVQATPSPSFACTSASCCLHAHAQQVLGGPCL